MSDVSGVLDRAGLRISVDEFLVLVEESANTYAGGSARPRSALRANEAATLEAVGADLAPLRHAELDERARAAIDAAVVVGTALSVREAADLLGVDPSRIRHRLSEGRLVGLRRGSVWRLPAWQFEDGESLPGLDQVALALPTDAPAAMVAAFMTTASPDLDLGGRPSSPREWLLAGGEPKRAAELAG
ncbi:MAG: helix-turn-helix domain-containing protein, partial [Acidimicrobiales bacterium]